MPIIRFLRRLPAVLRSCLPLAFVVFAEPRSPAVDLPSGFVAETLATDLNAATALAAAPGGRIFIADQTGQVLVWKAGGLLPSPALTLKVTDYWERGLIGMTLHPAFPNPPHLFLVHVTDRPFVHHVLSRFTMDGDLADPASELILLEGDDQSLLGGSVPAGHQGGLLRFGNDGRLLLSIGEQTAGEPSQKLDTLLGKILRLNPDGSIPDDNPFVTRAQGKYRSILAYGVRNSFGIGVQSREDGGRVFFTDVGGSAFEEINELKAGANYGWPRAEGFSTNAAFANPLHAYPPQVGQSIVGGTFLPRTGAWPEKWRGRFFYADFMHHWIKAMDPSAPTNVLTFARGLNGPVALELAPDGSLLVLNRGAVWRDPKKFVPDAGSLVRIRHLGEAGLARSSPTNTSPDSAPARVAALGLPMETSRLPPRLARADWEGRVNQKPARTFVLNDLEWHPFMRVETRVYLPAGGKVRPAGDGATLEFPPGTVFARDFLLASVTGPDDDRPVEKLVERRLHVVDHPTGYGASYRIDSTGDGILMEDGEPAGLGWGRSRDPGKAHHAEVTWWYPSLEPRLSRPVVVPAYWIPTTLATWNQADGPGGTNALRALIQAGLFDSADNTGGPTTLPTTAGWRSSKASAETRVRSYLDANCAVCHQPGGASRGLFDARISTPLAQAGIVNGELAAGDLGLTGARIVVPGAPEKSILVRRLRDTGFFRMPATQTHTRTSPIVPVVEDWIRSLPALDTSSSGR